MTQSTHTASQQKTAVLVALNTPQQCSAKIKEHVDELAFLAFTLGIKTVNIFIQNSAMPNSKTVVGKGKLEEIEFFVKDKQVDLVIFDDELRPSQLRNLERVLPCEVTDRNLLILDIFAMRARTNQAKTQVELAQYQYLLPRLTKMWSHLSKQKGGNTGMRGPGEKELETDRRLVQKKIAQLRRNLETINQQSITQRKTRTRVTRVALVGYTNVGKSTLMHLLSKENVYIEDKLFATISSTVRRVVLRGIPFLLTDTVGFIRKLPHTLIECFKATLDEVKEADILLHVVDVSNPAHEEHIEVVQKTLQEIGAGNIPTIWVFNKVDRLTPLENTPESVVTLPSTQQLLPHEQHWPSVFISATQQSNIEALRDLLFRQVYLQHVSIYPNYLKDSVY